MSGRDGACPAIGAGRHRPPDGTAAPRRPAASCRRDRHLAWVGQRVGFPKRSNLYQVRQFSHNLLPGEPDCPDATVAWTVGAYGGYSITYSYGMNTSDQPSRIPSYWTGWKINQIKSPADKIFFTDALGDVSYGGGQYPYSMRYLPPSFATNCTAGARFISRRTNQTFSAIATILGRTFSISTATASGSRITDSGTTPTIPTMAAGRKTSDTGGRRSSEQSTPLRPAEQPKSLSATRENHAKFVYRRLA